MRSNNGGHSKGGHSKGADVDAVKFERNLRVSSKSFLGTGATVGVIQYRDLLRDLVVQHLQQGRKRCTGQGNPLNAGNVAQYGVPNGVFTSYNAHNRLAREEGGSAGSGGRERHTHTHTHTHTTHRENRIPPDCIHAAHNVRTVTSDPSENTTNSNGMSSCGMSCFQQIVERTTLASKTRVQVPASASK